MWCRFLLPPLLVSTFALSIRVPFQRRVAPNSIVNFHTKPPPATTATNETFKYENVNAGGASDIYVGTILVNGAPFEVQLDTGSADLWLETSGVDATVYQATGVPGLISYKDGTAAQGPIVMATVTFGDFAVPSQALISALRSNATTNGDRGVLGLGPPPLSTIRQSLSKTSFQGKSFLEQVFSSYAVDLNIVTFLLSRSNTGITDGGIFTIGEVAPEYASVLQSKPLRVIGRRQRWTIPFTAVIVNGTRVDAYHIVHQMTTASLDTGNSLGNAPPYYVDTMYQDVRGASFNSSTGWYTLPCDSKLDISFVFGGDTFPMHPIDAITPFKDENGQIFCVGSFAYSASENDFALGDAFLRNVYSLYDFGKWATGTSTPYVKLLSTTNITQANAEFESMNSARLAQLQSAAVVDRVTSDIKGYFEHGAKDVVLSMDSTAANADVLRRVLIDVGILLLVIVIVGGATCLIIRTRKGYREVPTTSGTPPMSAQGSYKYITP